MVLLEQLQWTLSVDVTLFPPLYECTNEIKRGFDAGKTYFWAQLPCDPSERIPISIPLKDILSKIYKRKLLIGNHEVNSGHPTKLGL